MFGQGPPASKAEPMPLVMDSRTQLVTFSAIVPAPGRSRATILAAAIRWLKGGTSMENGESMVFYPPKGEVKCTRFHGVVTQSGGLDYYTKLWFTVTVAVEDGAYRYQLDHFRFESDTSRPYLHSAEGPIEPFIFKAPANRILREVTESKARAVRRTAMGFIENLRVNM
jgi:Domain of unknown function (DUF4468) with TBP-like fold